MLLVAPVTSAVLPSSLDSMVQNVPDWTGGSSILCRVLTKKGAATRARIVETAADLILERGVPRTSLDDICVGTHTSKSQVFHYFPGGKVELVAAIADFQSERVLDAQRPHLDELDTFESWERWRDAVIAHYDGNLACPISALTNEAEVDVRPHMDRWFQYIHAGVERMQRRRRPRPDRARDLRRTSGRARRDEGLALDRAARSGARRRADDPQGSSSTFPVKPPASAKRSASAASLSG